METISVTNSSSHYRVQDRKLSGVNGQSPWKGSTCNSQSGKIPISLNAFLDL